MDKIEDTNLLSLINEEKNSYENKYIQIVPGLLFNQKTLIEQIYFYYNSKFQSGDIDTDGDKKYFFNIVKNPCAVHTKAIDFDTKDIKVMTADGGNPAKTWYFERDLKQWMKEQKFGKVLNRIFKEIPIFGSVVLKMVNGVPMFVDLRNFIVEQSADTLDNANYIIERHPYTVMGFRKAAKEMGWNNAEEVVKVFREMRDVKHIMVYERYGEVMNNDGTWDYRRVYLADVGVDTENEQTHQVIPYRGILLKSDVVDSNPYWEFHLEKIPGRWLGIGVVEVLTDPQIKQNELANLQSKAGYFNAITLLQTRDTSYNKNLKTDVTDGQVLGSDSEITQINVGSKNLSYFSEETQKWLSNRNELVNAYAPVGTTPTAVQVAQQNFITSFEQIQENIALDVKELIYGPIIDQFKKETSAAHTLRLVGQDLDAYFQMVKGIFIDEEIVKLVIKSASGKNPFPQEQDKEIVSLAIEQSMKQGGEKLLPIPKGFYDDAKYQIDIEITGESKDSRKYTATLMAALQAITADPTITEDPTKRKFFTKYLEAGGVRFEDFMTQAKPQVDQMVEQGRAGGGVSAPSMPQQPMMGQVPQIK